VALCVLTGRDWLSDSLREPDIHRFRRRAVVMLALVYGQIVLGAWVRHYGTLAAVTAHALVATAVLLSALVLAVRVQRHKQDVPALVAWSRFLAGSAVAQVVLGIATLVYVLPLGGLPPRRDSTKRSYGPGIRPTRRSCSPRVWYSPFVPAAICG